MADTFIPLEQFIASDDDSSSAVIRDYIHTREKFDITVSSNDINIGSFSSDVIIPLFPIVITNSGYADIDINDIIVTGAFSFEGTKPTKLLMNSSVVIYIRTNVTANGIYTGSVYVDITRSSTNNFIKLTVARGE